MVNLLKAEANILKKTLAQLMFSSPSILQQVHFNTLFTALLRPPEACQIDDRAERNVTALDCDHLAKFDHVTWNELKIYVGRSLRK